MAVFLQDLDQQQHILEQFDEFVRDFLAGQEQISFKGRLNWPLKIRVILKELTSTIIRVKWSPRLKLVAGTTYEAIRTVFSVGWELMHCQHRGHHHDLIRCLAHWVYGLVNPLPWLPEPVKLVAGSAHEAVRTVFSVGWELMHCPERGHHHHLIACLGRWIQRLAPPLNWMPDPIKTLANGQITSLLPGQLNQIVSGDIMGLLPGQLNQIASGNILGLMPGPMQLLGGSDPNSIANMITMGKELMKCSEAAAKGDLVQCLGYKIIGRVPPLNFLNRLGEIFEEFIAAFAKVASKLATQAIKGGESLLQTAATTEFPSAGTQAMVHHRGRTKAFDAAGMSKFFKQDYLHGSLLQAKLCRRQPRHHEALAEDARQTRRVAAGAGHPGGSVLYT